MRIGYARISTIDQNVSLQVDALNKAGCEKIFQDISSGSKTDRPGLDELLAFIRSGDTLVVWRLDRLGRSLKHLINVIDSLSARQIGFQSLQEGFDTNTSGGKLVFQIFGSLAEFERNLIRERTVAGLAAARARGRNGGRKNKLTPQQIGTLQKMAKNKQYSVGEICQTMSISKPTYYKYLAKD